MHIQSRALLALLLCLSLLGACGQKGPLYLPGRSSSFESMIPEQQPAQEEPQPEEDKDDDDDNN